MATTIVTVSSMIILLTCFINRNANFEKESFVNVTRTWDKFEAGFQISHDIGIHIPVGCIEKNTESKNDLLLLLTIDTSPIFDLPQFFIFPRSLSMKNI